MNPLVGRKAFTSIPEEQSPTLMVTDVLRKLTAEVEIVEIVTSRRRRRDQAVYSVIMIMKEIVKSKLKYHFENKLSLEVGEQNKEPSNPY